MVMSHICFGRLPLKPVTHACLWGAQWLKHQLTNPHECTVTSDCFQQMLPVTSPSTALRIKGWWSEQEDIHEHLLKEAWESVVTAKPAVEINIIGVRLNFISLKTCLLPPEKSIFIFKFTLIWNIPHTELSHAFRITMPCCFFKHYKWTKQLTGGSYSTFRILVTSPLLFFSLNLTICMRNTPYRHK